MDSLPEQPTSVSKDKNVYIGTDGIALGSGNFRVDSNGTLTQNTAEIKKSADNANSSVTTLQETIKSLQTRIEALEKTQTK